MHVLNSFGSLNRDQPVQNKFKDRSSKYQTPNSQQIKNTSDLKTRIGASRKRENEIRQQVQIAIHPT